MKVPAPFRHSGWLWSALFPSVRSQLACINTGYGSLNWSIREHSIRSELDGMVRTGIHDGMRPGMTLGTTNFCENIRPGSEE